MICAVGYRRVCSKENSTDGWIWMRVFSGILTADTTNFWPLCHAFLSQRQDLVAIRGVIATICTFGCDRWNFCHANYFVALSAKIVATSAIATNCKPAAISGHCCHDLICVASSFIGVAVLRWYCNSLVDGCESTSMLQRIWFVVCNSRLHCKRVVHIATKKWIVAIAKVVLQQCLVVAI